MQIKYVGMMMNMKKYENEDENKNIDKYHNNMIIRNKPTIMICNWVRS